MARLPTLFLLLVPVILVSVGCQSRRPTSVERWNAWADEHFGPAEVSSQFVADGSARPLPRPADPTALGAGLPDTSAAHLRTKRVALVVHEAESLREAVAPLQAQGVSIVVMPRAEAAVADAGVVFNLDLPKPIRVTSALDLIARLAGDEVAWVERDGLAVFTTADEAMAAALQLRAYDVGVLTMALPNFRAPDLSGRGLIERDEESFGGVEEYVVRHEPDAILALVEETVMPGTWGENGTSLSLANGLLLVRHTPAAHLAVARLLAALQ